MIQRLFNAMSRSRLRREAAQRRREIAEADRKAALEAVRRAEHRGDTRGLHWARQRAQDATMRALIAELNR